MNIDSSFTLQKEGELLQQILWQGLSQGNKIRACYNIFSDFWRIKRGLIVRLKREVQRMN